MTIAHDDELLRVFKNSPDDLAANRAGRLGDGQLVRLRRKATNAVLIMIGVDAVFAAIVLLVASHPISAARWVLIVVVALAGLAVGINQGAKLRASVRARTVDALVGPVQVQMRGRMGWWLTVAGRSFHLPVRFWHVGPGVDYRVYVAPAAQLIVAMETAGLQPEDPPLNAVMLRSWATTMCVTEAAGSASVALALGFAALAGNPASMAGTSVEPPPAQTTRATIYERDQVLRELRFTPGPAPVTRGDLDAAFGAGVELVRVHWDSRHQVIYRMAVDGALFTCDVTAEFPHGPSPTAESVALAIVLRRS